MLAPLLGGAMGAFGANAQAGAQAGQYEAQARMAEINRLAAIRQASESLKEGAREEKRFRRDARQFAASQEARLAASGGAMGGSALNVMADTASGIEEDAEMLRYNTLKQKWGFDAQANNFANEAIAARASAASAKAAGKVGAMNSILGGISGAFSAMPIDAKTGGNTITIGANEDYKPYLGFGDTILPIGMTIGQQYNNYRQQQDYGTTYTISDAFRRPRARPGWWK
jgi:hypothetical protein